jgi:uncharacterized membrane protein YbhN (UPF0104 family)
LWQQGKNWPLLLAGFALAITGVCASFARWYVLVRALDLPFRLTEAFRLGFLGYLLNFVGVGSVGGDLFKAVFLARQQSGRRTEAVATVVIDRVAGLYGLLVVASAAILLSDLSHAHAVVRTVCDFTLAVTAGATLVVVWGLIPRARGGRMFRWLSVLPHVGPIMQRVFLALDVYRRKLGVLAQVGVLSLGIHVLLCVSLYMAASGLFVDAPTLGEHFVIVPLANVAGGLPFTPGGLGTFEVAMERLYKWLPATANDQGIIVALAYRWMTIVIALIGVIYYWSSRSEVSALLAKAEEEARTPAADADY